MNKHNLLLLLMVATCFATNINAVKSRSPKTSPRSGLATILESDEESTEKTPKASAKKAVDTKTLDAQLIKAVQKEDLTNIRLTISLGANVNTFDQDSKEDVTAEDKLTKERLTPLMHAAKQGNAKIAAILITHGADINAQSSIWGFTPLHFAVKAESPEIVTLLLKKGANVDTSSAVFEQTPLMHACQGSSPEIVKLLIKHKAPIDQKDNDGRTPLMYACEWAPLEIITLLLEKGADVNVCNNLGKTPLICATMSAMHHNSEDVVKLLIEHGALVNVQDKRGKTPLMHACENGQLQSVALLIKNHADMHTTDEEGKTALMHAAEKGNYNNPKNYEAIVKLLIKNGANVKAQNLRGKTVLGYAATDEIRHILMDELDRLEAKPAKKK